MTARRTGIADQRLSAQLAELSEILTRRCSDVFAAAHRGGPERFTLAARGHELQALQSELSAYMPAAADGNREAMTRVITLQRQTLALLDALQGRHGAALPDYDTRMHRADAVTMRPAHGPEGQTLWVADPSSRMSPDIGKGAQPQTSRSARADAAPRMPVKADGNRKVDPAAKDGLPARTGRRQSARSGPASAAPTSAASEPAADTKSNRRLLHIPLGTTAQLAAAGFIIVALMTTTASLVPTIAHRLRPPNDAAVTDNKPKPSQRLSAGAGTLAAVASTPTPDRTPPPGPQRPPPGQGYVAVVATHDTYAAARQAFVTLKGLYPLPLTSTAPDIRTVKGPGFKNSFELALLPAMARADADELCRRLLGLGHVTCVVKRDP